MLESNFQFVDGDILRQNLDETFNHILDLVPLIESSDYNETAKSSFRKTVIIHTASIVEALLFSIVDTKFSDDEIDGHYGIWKLKDKKELYKIADDQIVVAGEYIKNITEGQKEKMNLGQIAIFLENKKIIDKKIFKKIDYIRILRNKQHLNTQTEVQKYSKDDLEKAFSVASDIKMFVQEI